MIQIRKNVFETNSSSTHSLVMCSDDTYVKWVRGEMYYCNWLPSSAKSLAKQTNFYTEDEAKAICEMAGESWDEDRAAESYDKRFLTYEEFCDTDELEIEEYSYTTEKGDKIRAVAKYGYCG